MMYKEISKSVYKKFSSIEGNHGIASEYAIETILKLIKKYKVKSVLELGLGIGSISDAILKYSKAKNLNIDYIGTEANDYCLSVLNDNVDDFNAIKLYKNLEEVSSENKQDLIIVDGTDSALESIKKYSKKDTIVYVEGYRGDQVSSIKKIYPKSVHVEIISIEKNHPYGPFPASQWKGGGQLIFLEPSMARKGYAFKEKVNSYMKRRKRKFK